MNIRVHALVIRADRQGEADRLLTLFTKELGKVPALARSADKPSSKWAGCVEPFVEIEADLYAKREGALRYTLTQCRALNLHSGLRDSLLSMGIAALLCETLEGLVPEREVLPEAWDLAREAILRIETGKNKTGVLLGFTLKLLRILGLSPQLIGCVRCGTKYPVGKPARWSGREGGLICRGCLEPDDHPMEISAEGMSLFLSMIDSPLLNVAGSDADPKTLRRNLEALYSHTEYHCEWKPKTLSWLDSVT